MTIITSFDNININIKYSIRTNSSGEWSNDSSVIKDHYDILGAQRNVRILGVFARKKIRDNNKNYLQFIPRVLRYLYRDLQNPSLAKILDWHKKNFRDNVLF